MSSLSIDYSVTETTITLVGNLSVDWGGEGLYVKYQIAETGDEKDSGTITLVGGGTSAPATGSVSAVTFSGLSGGTTYTVTGKLYNNSDAYTGVSDTVSVTTTAPAVGSWSWTASNGSATAAQTKAAYTAITGNGYLSSFNYLVWNDLVYKAYEVITARGGSWNTTYGTLSASLMTTSDKEMTAARFNAVWWQCSQYINTGMGAASGGYCPVSTGDTIKGSYFIDLANAINNTIY